MRRAARTICYLNLPPVWMQAGSRRIGSSSLQLAIRRLLDRTEDLPDIFRKQREVQLSHPPVRMKHDVDRSIQIAELTPDSRSQAPLDAVPADGVPHRTANRQADSRARGARCG